MSIKLQNFHKTMSPALGVPLMSMHPSNPSSAFDGISFRTLFDPFNLLGAAQGLSHDLIRAPVDIAHEAGTAFTGGIAAVGNTVTGVAGSLENTASSLLSSPVILIGGAAVLILLLSR